MFQRIISFIGIAIIIAGGWYYYVHYVQAQNPEKVFENATEIPAFDNAIAYIQKRVATWEPDPEDPEIRVPKNWGRSEITVEDFTFTVISPDTNVPPTYYASLEFPKPLIKKTLLIKCWGTAKEKTTDICIVGNDPKLEAYFQILKLLDKAAPTVDKIKAMAPNVEMGER